MALKIISVRTHCPQCGHEFFPNTAHVFRNGVIECIYGGRHAVADYVAVLRHDRISGLHPLSEAFGKKIPYEEAYGLRSNT